MRSKRRGSNAKPLQKIRFLLRAVFFALFAAFLFAACPMEDDPDTSAGIGLDPRLIGTWRFEFGSGYEQFVIQSDGNLDGKDDTLTYNSNYSGTDDEIFAGAIVYAECFSSNAGIIIIEYLPGRKQIWIDRSTMQPLASQPPGNFYGIYYLSLNGDGTEVFLAYTSDQARNNGPTETETLEDAIAKFTQGNMNQLLDLSVGDPQHKVGG